MIPDSGKSPGKGNGNLLQYSCLENPMDRGAWWATVHGVAKNQTQLSIHTYLFICIYLASVLIEAFEIFDLCDGMQDFFLSFGM